MAGRLRVFFTENFAANLDAVRVFLEPEGRSAFRRLRDRLFEEVVPNLSRFPELGRSFLARGIRSVEAQALARRLRAGMRKGDDLRELIVDEYLILYVIRSNRLHFLAIKHHRQLSFNLKLLWL